MSFPSIEQNQHRNQLVAKLRHHMALYGYQSVELPFIEEADLFLTRAGDQIINRLFTFERFGKQLSLRPEFTASAVYRYGNLPDDSIVRWQFDGPVLIDTEDQAANHYQNYSIGAELIGMGGPVLDAEIILMATGGLKAQHITNFTLVMGHIGLMRHLLSYFSLDKRTERFLLHNLTAFNHADQGKAHILQKIEQALIGQQRKADTQLTETQQDSGLAEVNTARILDSLLDSDNRGTTMGGRTREDIARRLVQKQKRANELPQIIDALDFLEQWSLVNASHDEAFSVIASFIKADDVIGAALLAEWQTTVNLLAQHGIDQIRISPALSRDWDYYTGSVFEIQTDNGETLAGGGRYDELVSLICGKDAPAVGFAYTVDTLLRIAKVGVTPQTAVTITYTDQNSEQATHWAMRIRQTNIPVQLLPQMTSAISEDASAIINQDGHLVFKNKSYSADHLNAFINDLQGSTA